MNPLPTLDEIHEIAALKEPVLRNLNITQCYFALSQAMATRTGTCANWCTFATWASKQAGQSIRQEDLQQALEHGLREATGTQRALEIQSPEELRLKQEVLAAFDPRNILNASADAVARGNRKVFAEIGLEFARFLALFLEDTTPDSARLDRFCSDLRPGPPPEGQQFLKQAFTHYYQAFFEADAKKRAEWILLANIEIGFHEQTRLQPEIAEALNASIGDPRPVTRKILNARFPYLGGFIQAGFFLLHLLGRPAPWSQAIDHLLQDTRLQVRLLLTRFMMTLGLPHGKYLRLGENLETAFPENLQHLENTALLNLLKQVDPTPDSLRDSGALDWANLPDRLHYIVDLFRCYQETPDLLEPPFSPAQTQAIRTGQVPEGNL